MNWISVAVFVTSFAALKCDSRLQLAQHDKCEPIRIGFCQNLAYKTTIQPNLLGHNDQEEAEQEFHEYQFHTLIKLSCSPDIQLFLCAMYAPVCIHSVPKAFPPCRELCESARSGCVSVMQKFGFPWPQQFDCNKFPRRSESGGSLDKVCVDPGNLGSPGGLDSKDWASIPATTDDESKRPNKFDQMMDFVCPVSLRVPPEFEYQLKFGSPQLGAMPAGGTSPKGLTVIKDCGAPCYKLFFDAGSVGKMQLWVGLWAIVCLSSTVFTLATFIVDTGRFPYPEKPIIYMTFCYFVVSVVYLVGFGSQGSISCNEQGFPREGVTTEPVMKQGTLHDWRCSILGMLLYFFMTAGAIWWVVLTVAWFLSAGLKWGQESIDVIASYFHAVVWTLASLQTILVLILKKIEGDVLSGVCFVGVLDNDSLLYLVIAPFFVYLVVGVVFLLLGFASLLRIRSVMKRDSTKTDKLERLMMRISTFSILHILPASTVLACFIYEYINLPNWMTGWQERVCRNKTLEKLWQPTCRYPDTHIPDVTPPNFHVFMLKYVMIFCIGIFSGFWVWSGKTVATWKTFYSKACGGYRREANV